MPETPYYLTEDFCREHGSKGPAALSRAFPEARPTSWGNRRQEMRNAFPELVPLLKPDGKPRIHTAPDAVAGAPTAAEVFESSSERMEGDRRKLTKLLPLKASDLDDDSAVLTAAGFDPGKWTLTRFVYKAWNFGSKNAEGEQDVAELYACTLYVEPKLVELTQADIVAAFQSVEPFRVKPRKGGRMALELGIVDAHFGNSTLAWYRGALERIIEKITSRHWQQVIIPVGSDFFHVDNFKNTTSNGTVQSSVDWPAAVKDGTTFVCAIIESALESADEVYVYYEIGNHDESQTWMFAQGLAWKYPQVRFDLAIAERKVHRFGKVAIGITHGDSRNRKDLDRVFMSEFPAFASAKVREVHAAHYHHEMSIDQFGVVTRSLSTAARTDKWHREEGFVGACKRWMLFSYEPDALVAIDYV